METVPVTGCSNSFKENRTYTHPTGERFEHPPINRSIAIKSPITKHKIAGFRFGLVTLQKFR